MRKKKFLAGLLAISLVIPTITSQPSASAASVKYCKSKTFKLKDKAKIKKIISPNLKKTYKKSQKTVSVPFKKQGTYTITYVTSKLKKKKCKVCVDWTAPAISGVTYGKIYSEPVHFTVTDKKSKLRWVKINGQKIPASYDLSIDGIYFLEALDKAGNKSTCQFAIEKSDTAKEATNTPQASVTPSIVPDTTSTSTPTANPDHTSPSATMTSTSTAKPTPSTLPVSASATPTVPTTSYTPILPTPATMALGKAMLSFDSNDNTVLTKVENPASATSVEIPAGVSIISANAFANCVKLKEIVLPDSVTTIEAGAFSGCSSLTSIVIPKKVTEIKASAFANCVRLSSVTIPDSVCSIGEKAFFQCYSLTDVTFPSKLKSIGAYAFCDCQALTNIFLPENMELLDDFAFSNCFSLEDITINKKPETVKTSPFNGVLLTIDKGHFSSENTEKAEEMYGFSRCDADQNGFCVKDKGLVRIRPSYFKQGTVVVPSTITKISGNAFSGIRFIKTVTLPDSMTTMHDYCFYACEDLTSVILPSALTTLNSHIFENCYLLENITIPSTVNTIKTAAFANCASLAQLELPTSVASIEENAFSGCLLKKENLVDNSTCKLPNNSGLQFLTDDENGICRMDNYVFCVRPSKTTTKIVFPEGITEIGSQVFYKNNQVEEVYLPSTLTTISNTSFEYHATLRSISFKGLTFDLTSNILGGIDA